MTAPSPTAAPLTGRLPTLSPARAALSRLAFDARFARWLHATLGAPGLAVTRRRADAGWRLTVESAHGRFQVVVDVSAWPALQLAFAHDDAPTACDIATLLLGAWAQALAPSLGPCRIVAIEAADGCADVDTDTDTDPLPVVAGGATPVALRAADAGVIDRMTEVCGGGHAGAVDLAPFARLPLRPRLRLLSRAMPRSLLLSLREGDVVLTGDAPARLICGVGQTLMARVLIDLQESTVQLAEPPQITDDDAAQAQAPSYAPGAPLQTLDALQLPIAFELDTARVSLAELAAMRPGHAVELDVPLQEAAVRLVCHGQTLGQGQLVAIGDRLGVRITRLEFLHDAAVAG